MSGQVEHIHIAPAAGVPMQSLEAVQAVAHVGLTGDRYALKTGYWSYAEKSRDVTLIEAEEMERLEQEAGIQLAPGESRRNLTTRGVRLHDLVDKEFWIGPVLARGLEICEPCTHLAGLVDKPVIKPLVHRAGLRAELLTSGSISVGDLIRVEA